MPAAHRDDARNPPNASSDDAAATADDAADADDGRPLAPWPLRALSLAAAVFLVYDSPAVALVVGAGVLAVRPRIDVFPAWRVALGAIAIISTVVAVDWLAASAFGRSLVADGDPFVGALAVLAAVVVEWAVFHRDS